MTQPLHMRRHARPVARFNRRTLLAGSGGLGLVMVGMMLLPRLWHASETVVAKEPPAEQHLKLPEVITRELPARLVATQPAMIVQDAAPVVERQPPPQGVLDSLNPFATSQGAPAVPEKAITTATVPLQPPPPQATIAKPVKPKPKWDLLAKPDAQTTTAQATPVSAVEELRGMPAQQHKSAPSGNASATQGLIHPARWEIPANPLKTIYMSQTLTCRLLQAINSDLPGQFKMETTTPILNKFGYDTEILPSKRWSLPGRSASRNTGTHGCIFPLCS